MKWLFTISVSITLQAANLKLERISNYTSYHLSWLILYDITQSDIQKTKNKYGIVIPFAYIIMHSISNSRQWDVRRHYSDVGKSEENLRLFKIKRIFWKIMLPKRFSDFAFPRNAHGRIFETQYTRIYKNRKRYNQKVPTKYQTHIRSPSPEGVETSVSW